MRKESGPKISQKSIIIPIEKKKEAQKCVDFRTINLVTHASKIVLKILARRLEDKTEAYLGNEQFGFRRGLETRDGIAAV